ncbi:MAG TPA: methyltransferase domain-containing protein [Pyrinomonadaceae bacterium]|nr:methyltransferase domain-containing protein [Pyrinomonadaceae bacterium]
MLTSIKRFAISQLDRLAQALPHNAKYYLLTHSLTPAHNGVSLNREQLAYIYIRGEGLELGALNNPLPVSSHAHVKYVDFATAEAVAEQFPGHAVKTPDIVDDAVTLNSVEDCSQDFVIACHILEHLEDPIGAIKTWFRVLKPGGVLFMSIPDRRFTFDFNRRVTPLAHLFADHEQGPAWSRAAHLKELENEYRSTYQVQDDEVLDLLMNWQREGRGHTHFHVWTQLEMLELMLALRRSAISFDFECFCAYGIEGTFVLRKGSQEGSDVAEKSLQQARVEMAELIQSMRPNGSNAKGVSER